MKKTDAMGLRSCVGGHVFLADKDRENGTVHDNPSGVEIFGWNFPLTGGASICHI